MNNLRSLPFLARIFHWLLTAALALGALAGVAIAPIALIAAFGGAQPAAGQAVAVEAPVSYEAALVDEATGEAVQLQFRSAWASLRMEAPPRSAMLTFALGFLGIYALLMAGFFKLRQIMGSLRGSQPFTRANSRRLYAVAYLTLGIGIWVSAMRFAVAWQMGDLLQVEGLRFTAGVDWGNLLAGVVLLMVAEVFKIGVAMREESDLTI